MLLEIILVRLIEYYFAWGITMLHVVILGDLYLLVKNLGGWNRAFEKMGDEVTLSGLYELFVLYGMMNFLIELWPLFWPFWVYMWLKRAHYNKSAILEFLGAVRELKKSRTKK